MLRGAIQEEFFELLHDITWLIKLPIQIKLLQMSIDHGQWVKVVLI